MTRKVLTRKAVPLLLALLAVLTAGLVAAESASAAPDINWGYSSEWGFVPI